MRITRLWCVAVLVVVSSSLFGAEVTMHFQREAVGVKSFAAPPRIAQRLTDHAAVLGAAEVEAAAQVEAIREWNAAGRLPAKNGFVRPLRQAVAVSIGPAASKRGGSSASVLTETQAGTAFGTSFKVSNAKRLRLHLRNVDLPEGTVLWVYGASGSPVGFDASLADNAKGLWTPSVDGEVVYLEVEVPKEATRPASFEVTEVLELLYAKADALRPALNDPPTCLSGQNANCTTGSDFPAIAAARTAVGQMEFVVNGSGAVCSGTLINDRQSSGTPYFLTANHCISSQTAASSLETYFDFVWTNCNWEQWTFLPPVSGSTLLVTTANSDVTLLRLSSLPAGRNLLGWDSSALPNGAQLHRLSHPVPDGFNVAFPQMYSRTLVKTTGTTCSGAPRPNFIYSNESPGGEGGVYGGSSGSAAILSNNANDARIVGQLLGSCGPDPAAGCDRRNDTMDGAFSASYSVLAPFIDSVGTQPQPCVPSSDTICLVNNRFAVKVTYDAGQGSRPMTAIKYTPDTGLFWFTGANNIEILLKMIDACSFNQRFWVFVGGTTDVGVGITVTDTSRGTVKSYSNPRGTKFLTITDTSAFATCP